MKYKYLKTGIKMNNTKEKFQIVDEHWQMFEDISQTESYKKGVSGLCCVIPWSRAFTKEQENLYLELTSIWRIKHPSFNSLCLFFQIFPVGFF